jgi:hypothetical protein
LRYTAERAEAEARLAAAALEELPRTAFRDGLTALAQFAINRRF